jgi:hypothetical protein
MEAPIKSLLLRNNVILISQIIEMDSELGEPNCKLINPCEINDQGQELSFKFWMNSISDQKTFMIQSENIITIMDVKINVLKSYLDFLENN